MRVRPVRPAEPRPAAPETPPAPAVPPAACIGRIVETPGDGTAMVQVGAGKARRARVTAAASRDGAPLQVGDEVLLVHEGGDPERPIVVDRMRATGPEVEAAPASIPAGSEGGIHAVVDGRCVTVRAAEVIELRCGKGCIRIQRDGRIVVRGTHLVQRASEAIRLKGGHVDIN